MRLVRCVVARESKPEQVKVGKLYWVDDSTKYTDSDGDEYVTVYSDAEGTKEVGNMLTKHFENDYQYIRYGLSLSSYVNDIKGNLLEDILKWCNDNAIYVSLARDIWKYIQDNGIDKQENMKKEYLVKHTSFKELCERGIGEAYMNYMGYYIIPNE